MCLAIPARVTEVNGTRARVEILGNTREANLALVEHVKVDDYILLHAGFAIQKLGLEDAKETLSAFEELRETIHDDLAP